MPFLPSIIVLAEYIFATISLQELAKSIILKLHKTSMNRPSLLSRETLHFRPSSDHRFVAWVRPIRTFRQKDRMSQIGLDQARTIPIK